ncbi:hypothetical protein [Desulfitobacterium hafniense]|uniref:hypothetical protein n=1 Tax=Desulfitobacterium hafniense TaxID=49338 RepID=UPI001AEC0BB4|nr:hypothetical protein [Desulfitobacterium hafniense]
MQLFVKRSCKKQITVIIDRKWAHSYDDPAQAANDYKVYQQTGQTDDWDGNEPELLNEGDTTYCLVMDEDDIEDAIRSYISDPVNYSSYGANEHEFIAHLANENE